MPQQKTILLADNDLHDQELFVNMIARANASIEVHTVPAGKDVISYLQKCPPDELPCLVVLDEHMPLMGPEEILPVLTQDPRYRKIVFAAWSESGNEEHKKALMQAGAKAYFVKPFSEQEARDQAVMMLALCGIIAFQ